MKKFVPVLAIPLLGVILAALAAITARSVGVRSASRQPLAVLGTVPDFSLTERSSRSVGLSDLRGRIWVADFIFTRCAGPCPVMTSQMARLQAAMPSEDRPRLVSFTVDPEHDTPAVLSKYAKRYGAVEGRWLFLTGQKDAIYRLARRGFHLGASVKPPDQMGPGEEPFIHSQSFVLVDPQARIRGYYNGTDAEAVQRLRQDVDLLLRETKPE